MADHRRPDILDQHGVVEIQRRHPTPGVIGESRTQPGVGGEPGVDGLPVVQVVGEHGGRARGPRLVGAHHLLVTVLVGDHQRGDRAEAITVQGSGTAPGQSTAEPAIAQREAQDDGPVGLVLEQFGDGVRAIAQPPLIAGPARTQHIVADLDASEVGLEDALGARQQFSRGDRTVTGLQRELGAQQWCVLIVSGADHGGSRDLRHVDLSWVAEGG